MNRHRIKKFSTTVEIAVSDHILPGQLLDVYDFFEGTDKTFSRFREDSELSWLNRQIGKKVMVSAELFDVLQLAYQFFDETDGIFDPGILSFLEKKGYTESIEQTVENAFERSMVSTNLNGGPPYELSAEQHQVTLLKKIDLGGIAKGWIVDQSVKRLGDYGYGFINIGGDIRVFGELPRAFHIGIEDPEDSEKTAAAIDVWQGGLATSSTTKRRWQTGGGKWYHHLIDPTTGRFASSSIVSATVLAQTCTEADIWAKTVLILGMEKGLAKIRENGQQAVLIEEDGTVVKERVS